MMLLAKMEYCSSLFPSLCLEDTFQSFDSYGRKKKKKESADVAECRLDSPCNSPEVLMSIGVEDSRKLHHQLLHSDSFITVQDPADYSSMFGGVDMEGFYEISASMTAGEDIMLSSGAKESKVMVKDVATRCELSKLDVSQNDRSAIDSNGLQSSHFEGDVDALLDNCLWRNREVSHTAPVHDLLPDLSGLAVSGYLLSDIPSHPDLSGEAGESLDSPLTFCNDRDESLTISSAVPHIEQNKQNISHSIKCEEDICCQDACDTVCVDFGVLCTNTLLDDMQSHMTDCPSSSSCQCCSHDCLCYKSGTSSAEEEDVCIDYVLNQHQTRVRRARGRSTRMVRRGPGRPRKSQNVDLVRRGPGRPRKKSVSDAVVWYQSRRKRTVSFSNGYKSRSRQTSVSDDKDAQIVHKRHRDSGDAADRSLVPKRSCRGDNEVQCKDYQPDLTSQRPSSLQSLETGTSLSCNSVTLC